MFRKYLIVMSFSLAMVGSGLARADLVANGGFESGDFTGWTVSGSNIAIDTVFPNNGTYDANFTDSTTTKTPSTLSQSLTAVAGVISYNLSFAVVDEAGFSGDSFTVNLGGFSTTITGDNAAFSYTLEQFNLTPTQFDGGLLSFQGLNDPTFGAAWNLDDVSVEAVVVTSVPEPSTLFLLLTAFVTGIGIFQLRRRRGCVASNRLPSEAA